MGLWRGQRQSARSALCIKSGHCWQYSGQKDIKLHCKYQQESRYFRTVIKEEKRKKRSQLHKTYSKLTKKTGISFKINYGLRMGSPAGRLFVFLPCQHSRPQSSSFLLVERSCPLQIKPSGSGDENGSSSNPPQLQERTRDKALRTSCVDLVEELKWRKCFLQQLDTCLTFCEDENNSLWKMILSMHELNKKIKIRWPVNFRRLPRKHFPPSHVWVIFL